MKARLKPIDQQTIVITGASSGIGLAAARAGARAGARVMLAARDKDALASVADEINEAGGEADYLMTDVGDENQVRALAERAVARFGGFDTWVNNAGVGLISTVDKTSAEDHAALFQTNYFGLVFGSVAAVDHFRKTGRSGALINVGSVVGDMPIPLSVAYSATKHAVKGFTDGLRLELMQEQLPVSVTLIKPSAIDTKFFDHAKSNMGGIGKAPGPVYAPEVVAAAILFAAENPRRHFPVGASATFGPIVERFAPRAVDRSRASATLDDLVDFGHQPQSESLREIPREGSERSRAADSRRYSLTTSAQMHPRLLAAGALVVAGLALLSLAGGPPASKSRRLQPVA